MKGEKGVMAASLPINVRRLLLSGEHSFWFGFARGSILALIWKQEARAIVREKCCVGGRCNRTAEFG